MRENNGSDGMETPLRQARVFMHGRYSGTLEELKLNEHYRFIYSDYYAGPPVSLTMPVEQNVYEFSKFPSFFEGLLPEGVMLEGLLRQRRIDENDCFAQLMAIGGELVGAVTVEEIK
jgi:serine/threonine-protein kinase HipA